MERSGKVYLYSVEISAQECFQREIKNELKYLSEFKLIDFLKTFPDEVYSKEMLEKMKNLLMDDKNE